MFLEWYLSFFCVWAKYSAQIFLKQKNAIKKSRISPPKKNYNFLFKVENLCRLCPRMFCSESSKGGLHDQKNNHSNVQIPNEMTVYEHCSLSSMDPKKKMMCHKHFKSFLLVNQSKPCTTCLDMPLSFSPAEKSHPTLL